MLPLGFCVGNGEAADSEVTGFKGFLDLSSP
jgi:hypothetical protein